MYNFETRQQFIQQRALGMSLASIAKKLNIHKNTALNWDNLYDNEINAEQNCAIGLALSASGAGRIDRAKLSAEILNRLAKKLLGDSAQMDNQTLASYIKLCQMLDKADPPPAPIAEKPNRFIPFSFDPLAEKLKAFKDKAAESPAHPAPEESASTSITPAPEPPEQPESVDVNTETPPAESGDGEPPEVHAEISSAADEEARKASEEFWNFYRKKMGRN